MYSLFDTDKNGILDFNEVVGAISILCKGSLESKIAAFFALSGDKGLTFKEL